MPVREPTPAGILTTPRRRRQGSQGGGGDSLTSAVIELSMAVGELKNAVSTLSSQGEAQTRELREIREQIIGAKAIAKFIAAVAGFIGIATIVKLWPIIHAWFVS